MRCRLCPALVRTDRIQLFLNNVVIDAILNVGRSVWYGENPFFVGFVLRKQEFFGPLAEEKVAAEIRMLCMNCRRNRCGSLSHGWLDSARHPRPGVAIPQCRKQPQAGILPTAIVDTDANEDIFGPSFGVLDENIEVAIAIEDTGIDEFVFSFASGALLVRNDDVLVGKALLRVLVQVLHVRVRGRAVDVKVVVLHVLAMIAFAIRKSEEAFLQDRISFVPERESKAQQLLIVTNASQSVFSPTVSARSRLVVGEIVPRVAVDTVVFAHGSPLALAEVRPPFLPGNLSLPVFVEADMLSCAIQHERPRGTGSKSRRPQVVRRGCSSVRMVGRPDLVTTLRDRFLRTYIAAK